MIGYGFTSSAGKATIAPVNLVLNPSATTTSTTNYAAVSRTTSVFKTAPASWFSLYYEPSETQVIEYSDGNMLTLGTRYSLSFWARRQFDEPILVQFYTGSTAGSININPSTTAFEYFKIENQLCSSRTSGGFFMSSYADFYIDDIAIVEGPTAL